MFYRAPGELESELREMDECMPHYYKITGDHGQGAERIMRAEAAYHAGAFHGRAHRAGGRLCPDRGQRAGKHGALLRLSGAAALPACRTCSSAAASTSGMQALLRRHNAAWINIWSATAAYYYALRGETERIPEIFRAAPARVTVQYPRAGQTDDRDDRKSGLSARRGLMPR